MSQEQAKSPSVESESGKDEVKDEANNKTEQEARAPEQRRASLTERLRAEQRKTEPRTSELGAQESKTSDLKPRSEDAGAIDLGDAAAGNAAAKPITRSRRPAGPAQRRITTAAAANDDVPPIGGLDFAPHPR